MLYFWVITVIISFTLGLLSQNILNLFGRYRFTLFDYKMCNNTRLHLVKNIKALAKEKGKIRVRAQIEDADFVALFNTEGYELKLIKQFIDFNFQRIEIWEIKHIGVQDPKTISEV